MRTTAAPPIATPAIPPVLKAFEAAGAEMDEGSGVAEEVEVGDTPVTNAVAVV